MQEILIKWKESGGCHVDEDNIVHMIWHEKHAYVRCNKSSLNGPVYTSSAKEHAPQAERKQGPIIFYGGPHPLHIVS